MKFTSDYTGLVTSAHLSAPKFMQTIAVSAAPYADLFNELCMIPQLFDVDIAQGKQLDMIGQWVGVARSIDIEVTGYFSHDVEHYGWDEGKWWEVGDPLQTTQTLDDHYFRALLKARILANRWQGDGPGVVDILKTLLKPVEEETGQTYAITITEGVMQADITVVGPPLPSSLQYVLIGEYLPLKPVGVTVNWHFPKGGQ